ncbi:MAG: acyltransferase family protein [Lachnospiraceae bacterium]|nr:acyltransferase family protein [Lachnospiraceae bacterium]
MENNQKRMRTVYFEALRLLAMFCVLFNHSGQEGYWYYTLLGPGVKRVVAIAASSYCKIGVLLFFMISGALLLGKEEEVGTFFRKRILKYLLIILVWNVIYHGYICFVNEEAITWLGILHAITGADTLVSYWFLYSYFGYLCCLPLMRRFVKSMKEADYWYLAGLYVVGACLFSALARTNMGQIAVTFPLVVDAFVYPMMGHFLANVLQPKYTRVQCIWMSCGAIFLGLGLNVALSEYQAAIFGGFHENSLFVFSFLVAMGTFSLTKVLLGGGGRLAPSVILLLGSGVFGVYLMEPYLKAILGPVLQRCFSMFPPVLENLCYIAGLLFLGSLLSAGLKKIPGIRTLL